MMTMMMMMKTTTFSLSSYWATKWSLCQWQPYHIWSLHPTRDDTSLCPLLLKVMSSSFYVALTAAHYITWHMPQFILKHGQFLFNILLLLDWVWGLGCKATLPPPIVNVHKLQESAQDWMLIFDTFSQSTVLNTPRLSGTMKVCPAVTFFIWTLS
jgi:hypothetical protein